MPEPGLRTRFVVSKSVSVAPFTLKNAAQVEAIGVPGSQLETKRVMPGALSLFNASSMLMARSPAHCRVVAAGSFGGLLSLGSKNSRRRFQISTGVANGGAGRPGGAADTVPQ